MLARCADNAQHRLARGRSQQLLSQRGCLQAGVQRQLLRADLPGVLVAGIVLIHVATMLTQHPLDARGHGAAELLHLAGRLVRQRQVAHRGGRRIIRG